jgi:asparagine synthase (glutamine-hydrolysing)
MCGIAGQVRTDGQRVDPGLMARMCAAVKHRGPDARGTHVVDAVGLGVQRLRVIDLVAGDQPIYNEDRSVVVVLNGEIYNFRELRTQLRSLGHTFMSETDTEVIVHLYEERGLDCVRALHGMFAFALWDDRAKRLLLARDRVGKKPLFYSHSARGLTFASELRALLEDSEISREIDYQAIDCYLAYQYIPAPLSAFREIRKLPPASTLVLGQDGSDISSYWELDYGKKRRAGDPRELHEEIRETIRTATRRRMVADVPLGAFLSGGVDSSAIVAAMAECSTEPVKTFSIGFDHQPFNELPFAKQIAERFGTEHHEFVVKPDAVDIIPRIVRQYGEPFGDSSAIPSFYVSELTRRHVTVALNGDGGDESFGGYNRYVASVIAGQLSRMPGPLRRVAGVTGKRIPYSRDMASTRSRVGRLLSSLAMEAPQRYAGAMSYFDVARREDAYTPEFKARIGTSLAPGVIEDPWGAASGNDLIDVLLEVDVKTYLPGDLLVKMDIATMAHGLEARSPLLDTEVMELAASLPANLKVHGTQTKVALRDAMRAWIPDSILDRPKWGFGVPLAEWFRDELRGYLGEILFDPVTTSRGYFREGVVREYFDSHMSGRMDNSPRLWALLVLELWHREFIDSPTRA